MSEIEDPTTPRQFEQTAARYNEEAAARAIAARENFLIQQQAAWRALLVHQDEKSHASFLAHIEAIKQIIKE